MEQSVFLGVSHIPSQGAGPSLPQIFGTPYLRAPNVCQILHGDQTRCDDNFYRVDHEC